MTLVERYRRGDPRALARLLSLAEADDPAVESALTALRDGPRRARVVGLTGPPGAGKSTLAGALIAHWRGQGRRVGVLAIDPSSPKTGGAALGDRLRLVQHATDAGVFIRSMAARGWPGGLAAGAGRAVDLLAGFGFDLVLVETVGVGQGEVDVARLAEVVVVVQAPGAGDEMQAIKAGLLEIADIIAVTKADQPGAATLAAQLRALAAPASGSPPPVVLTSATTGAGIPDLVGAIDAWRPPPSPPALRLEAARAEILASAVAHLRRRLGAHPELDRLARRVMTGDLDPSAAGAALAALLTPTQQDEA